MRLHPTFRDKCRARLRGIPGPRELEPSLSLLGDLRRIGWFASFSAGPQMSTEPVPWLTYPALYWLSTVRRELRAVFEYGSGASTLWWAKRSARVTAVEHDLHWFRRIAQAAPANVSIKHRDGDDYCTAICDTDEQFDVVVIDGGPSRNACVAPAIERLAADGLVIFDDTHLSYHAEGVERLHADGLRRIDFVGPRPGSRFIEATSIFSRSLDRWAAADGVPAYRPWFDDGSPASAVQT